MSSKYECTQERFLEDVKDHQISIEKDDGVNRFVKFRRDEGSSYWFNLTTWPGNLCISGDCGTYVFSREKDMFGFFKMNDGDFNKRKGVLLNINPHYWGENLKSIGTNAGYMEFDCDVFGEKVRSHFASFFAGSDYSDEAKEAAWDEVNYAVISYSDEEHQAYAAINNFKHDLLDGKYFEFVDFFDGGGAERYTFHYIWCLYAIVWGIIKYDEAKTNENRS